MKTAIYVDTLSTNKIYQNVNVDSMLPCLKNSKFIVNIPRTQIQNSLRKYFADLNFFCHRFCIAHKRHHLLASAQGGLFCGEAVW